MPPKDDLPTPTTMFLANLKKLKLTTLQQIYDIREKRLKNVTTEHLKHFTVIFATAFAAILLLVHLWSGAQSQPAQGIVVPPSPPSDGFVSMARPSPDLMPRGRFPNVRDDSDMTTFAPSSVRQRTTASAVRRLLLRNNHNQVPSLTAINEGMTQSAPSSSTPTPLIPSPQDAELITIISAFQSQLKVDLNIEFVESGTIKVAAANQDADAFIVVVLPLHEFNETSLKCSDNLNPTAIADMKGSLALVNEVNGDSSFLANTTFGIVVIDSCSSPIYVKKRVFKYLKSAGHTISGDIPIKIVGFVSSLRGEESRALVESLGAFQMTLISSKDLAPSGLSLGLNKGLFQVPVTSDQILEATLNQANYLNWTRLSVVKEKFDVQGEAVFDSLLNLVAEKGVCISEVSEVDQNDARSVQLAADQLITDRDEKFAEAIIILTNFNATREVVKTISEKSIDGFNLILLKEGNLNIVRGLEQQFSGALIVNEERANLRNFLANFGQNLTMFMPTEDIIRRHSKVHWKLDISSTLNTMQGVIAMISGFARLRDNFCGEEIGLCSRLESGSNLRNKLNYYVQYTASMKLDSKGSSELFSFKRNGFGAKNVDILHFKKEDDESEELINSNEQLPNEPGRYYFEKVARFFDDFERIDNTSYVLNYGAPLNEDHSISGSVTVKPSAGRCV